ncbi:MAG: hypothetical protein NTU61_01845 [Candidatus Altiarchaeota archaeon]|nr:hypothetical protein [Candidatus Altiarchaeota archaeon]
MSGCTVEFLGAKVELPIGESSTTTVTTPFCRPPYMQIGNECCLDRNRNGICDSDEGTTGDETGTTQPAGVTQTTIAGGATTPTTVPSGATQTTLPATATTQPASPTTTHSVSPTTTLEEETESSTTTIAAASPTTTIAASPTTTLHAATTTTVAAGPMGGGSTTTTLKACSNILMPSSQTSCNKGACSLGYKCTFHGEYIKPKCTCEWVGFHIVTTTTLFSFSGPCGDMAFGLCGMGTCPTGKYCATKYSSGWIPTPIGCECKTSSTTTTTLGGPHITLCVGVTLPGAGVIVNTCTISSSPACTGTCSSGKMCTAQFTTTWIGGMPVITPTGCTCVAASTTTTTLHASTIVTLNPGLITTCAISSPPACGGTCSSGKVCRTQYKTTYVGGMPILTPIGCFCATPV